MKILLIGGSGPTAQVYATILSKNHFVGLYMKSEHLKEYFEPHRLYSYSMNPFKGPNEQILEKFLLVSDVRAAAEEKWDQSM